MKHRLHPGDHMPEFSYDTPYEAQSSFYALLQEDERPLFLIFLRNFGHPFTRHYIVRYAQTIQKLYSARLVCVVRTRPETIGPHLPKGTMPYPVICDAEGALYDYFEIPRVKGRLRTLSWEGRCILKEAEKQGYQESKEVAQQMPLTLLIAPDGEVLLAHYGKSVTDQPEDCEAMERVFQELWQVLERERRKALRRNPQPEPFPEEEDGEPVRQGESVPDALPAEGPEEPPEEPQNAPSSPSPDSALPMEMPRREAPLPPPEPSPEEGRLGEMVFGEEDFEEIRLPPATLPARPKQAEDKRVSAALAFAASPGPASFAPPRPEGDAPSQPNSVFGRRQEPAAQDPAAPQTPPPSDDGPRPEQTSKADGPAAGPGAARTSAAEDIALQKFRSAAAALFSDEL